MTSSPNRLRRYVLVTAILVPLPAAALLAPWLQRVRANASFEAALYRMMDLPGARVFFPRPPKESIAELNKLPDSAELHVLRAQQEEAALDFAAAENDWKAFTNQAPDHIAALLQLADFYHRRLAVQQELATLLQIGNTAPLAAESFVATSDQRSWQAFERARSLADAQSLDEPTVLALYSAWIARYTHEPTAYARAITWAADHHRFTEADALLAQYRVAFPADRVFPIKAAALLALRRGGADADAKALAVYDEAFDPLWPDELNSSYFALLESTHNLRHFLADANARLDRNPDDIQALGRIYRYQQSQQHPEAATAAIDQYRRSKEGRKAPWSPAELAVLAQLSLDAHDPASAARYDFALYGSPGAVAGEPAKQLGLENMIALLLSTPEQPITLGSGNLSMYRDIATLDRGPGLWNGILSLWFNGQSPNNELASEESKARPYFQRAKAAELLALLDREDPASERRATLHAELLHAYATYGDDAAVIREGNVLLTQFPAADTAFRLSVAMSMADAFARRSNTNDEFTLYDRMLGELAARLKQQPLTAAALGHPSADATENSNPAPTVSTAVSKSFELNTSAPSSAPPADAVAYAQVLDRYLGRLTSAKKLPEALAVLRKEIDRNPNDPQLYEKLASFLGQNNLSAEQEDVYRRAMEKFQDATWTDKLARFYIRTKRNQDFATLTRKVVDTFEGTAVEDYFRRNAGGGQQLFVQLNLYAHQHFPHDTVFTNNLLAAYAAKPTADRAAWEALLRETWWQTPELTRQFFEFLSSSGKLDAELATLQPADANPAAQQEAAEAELWRSHQEASAPLFASLSNAYPADATIGTTASDLQRSLAWFDPAHTQLSLAIEQRLLSANPGDLARLARIGDILADHADDSAESLAASAKYWRQMPSVAPDATDSYLQAATIFWDYFQFDSALQEISSARAHFQQPTLFGYEAGAIAEGKRDDALAVREYAAAAAQGDDRSTARLLQLARRPATAALVDIATSSIISTPGGLSLRMSTLTPLHRSGDAGPLLQQALKNAKDSRSAEAVADLAKSHSLTAVYEQTLARQAELAADPVEKLELRYQLARAYEDRGDIAAAARVIDAIYGEHPLLLGVVRSTVDFDWRTQHQADAIKVLVSASHAAQPVLSHQLLAEAAEKANDSGDTKQARALAESLLTSDPYNAEYLALAADSYVRANDDVGLKQFYTARLEATRTAPMDELSRRARVAMLRKGLIPALTRGKDYDGATAQYIALISAYPEDAALNNEAALYALRYGRREQLIGFFATTTQASPRDSRFFIALAQAQTVFGDPAAAIDAYARAVAVRKDRVDVYTAKAALEETLQRFDEAASDYQRLYTLTYKDPSWVVAVARVRARQGRAADALAALKTAYLAGPKHVPHDYFVIAAQLEQWNFLPEAAEVAVQGRTAAGDAFLSADDSLMSAEDVGIYARILIRLRRAPEAFAALHSSLSAATVSASSPSVIAAQVHAEGVGAFTDADWRKQEAAARKQRANDAFQRALTAMGTAVDNFYTPEERVGYSALLDAQRSGATPKQLAETWIPAAHAAGLTEEEAIWRREILIAPGNAALAQVEPLATLQRSRLRLAEFGQALEAFLKLHPKSANVAVTPAADAYRDAGDGASEARILRTQNFRDDSQSALRDRYLNLLARRDTTALTALAGSRTDTLAEAAANTALSESKPAVALAAIAARGKMLPVVWSPATTGLAQLFFADTTGAGDTALRSVLLSDVTIADRLAAKPDASRQLVGELWFYYAGRDAQLRLLTAPLRDSAEDLMAADLEYAPTAAHYEALAQTYAEAGNVAAALIELDHVLELDPHDAAAFDRKALILWNSGRKDEALAAWRMALSSLRVIEDRAAAPESFWSEFKNIAHRIGQRGLYAQTKSQMDDVLRIYIARNGNYRSNELLIAAYGSASAPAEGTAWLISLASVAVDPLTLLQELTANENSLPVAAREPLIREQLRLAQRNAASAPTDDYARSRILAAQTSLVRLYLNGHKDEQALALLNSLEPKQLAIPELQHAQAVASARLNKLEPLMAKWRSSSESAPSDDTLRSAANDLAAQKLAQPARALLEFAFERALTAHTLTSTDYLALADSRLKTQDAPGAMALLRSLIQSAGDPYTNLDSAAALLEKSARPADALPFLTPLARSVPWDLSYALRLAEARLAANQQTAEAQASLASIAGNPLAPYALRTRAAMHISSAPATLGSAELTALASKTINPATAQQPFFVAARIAAAEQSHDAKQRDTLLREALAIAPNTPDLLLKVFRAEVHVGNMATAHAAMESLTTGLPSISNANADGETIESASISDYSQASLPASAASLSPTEQSELAAEFSAVEHASGDASAAILYLKLALHLAPQGATAAKQRATITAMEWEIRLAAANAARRPTVRKDLAQPLTVRARLSSAPDGDAEEVNE